MLCIHKKLSLHSVLPSLEGGKTLIGKGLNDTKTASFTAVEFFEQSLSECVSFTSTTVFLASDSLRGKFPMCPLVGVLERDAVSP